MISLAELIELTKEVESEDPIDWGMLSIDEEAATKIAAMDVMEMYNKWKTTGQPETIMLVTITKLVLENFMLNLKLQGINNGE